MVRLKSMLSVLINHYRSPVALKLCLRSIRETLAETPHEVIVSDSAAERETGRMLRSDFPEVHYLEFARNVGFAKLVNAGLRAAGGDPLLILNADTVLIENTAKTLAQFLQAHPDVGMVGPRLEYQNGSHQPSAFRFYTPAVIAARRTFFGRTPWGRRVLERFMLRDILSEPIAAMAALPVDWLMGSAFMVRRKAAEEVGELDERFFLYFEDVDWCRRFWERGYKVMWFPSARVVHVHAQASRKRGALFDIMLNPLTRIHVTSAVKYFRKHGLATPHYGV